MLFSCRVLFLLGATPQSSKWSNGQSDLHWRFSNFQVAIAPWSQWWWLGLGSPSHSRISSSKLSPSSLRSWCPHPHHAASHDPKFKETIILFNKLSPPLTKISSSSINYPTPTTTIFTVPITQPPVSTTRLAAPRLSARTASCSALLRFWNILSFFNFTMTLFGILLVHIVIAKEVFFLYSRRCPSSNRLPQRGRKQSFEVKTWHDIWPRFRSSDATQFRHCIQWQQCDDQSQSRKNRWPATPKVQLVCANSCPNLLGS